jgi:hypothetical protein
LLLVSLLRIPMASLFGWNALFIEKIERYRL